MEGQNTEGLVPCPFVNKKYTCAARSCRVMGPLAGAGALLHDKKAHCLDADLTTQTNRGNNLVD